MEQKPRTMKKTKKGISSRPGVPRSAGAGAGLALSMAELAQVHAAGNEVIRVGLVGCGGRGTGAGLQAMRADPAVRLLALGDIFRDRLEGSRAILQREGGSNFAVTDDKCFTGFDAYRQVIDCGVDVVLLGTPPHFRPQHLAYAVQKGKHVFAEKPVAVDAPGIRTVLEAFAQASRKKLSVVSGLCWRYHHGLREAIRRIHDGAIGRIVSLQGNFDRTAAAGAVERRPGWTDIDWQIRNYPHFLWLSGDWIVDALVHQLDVVSWVMKGAYPVQALGFGGRQTQTLPGFSNLFDHHAIYYEFADGARCHGFCKQQTGTAGEYSVRVFGSKGSAILMQTTQIINGPQRWRSPGRGEDMWQQEQNELFAGIRSGRPLNNGEYMAKSTLMGIQGRMAAYTGQIVTWDQALASTETLGPRTYQPGPIPVSPVPIPGVSRLR